MKAFLVSSGFFASLMISLSAQAIVYTEPRPFWGGEMSIEKSEGMLAGVKDLWVSLAKYDGTKDATHLVVTIDGTSHNLKIASIKKADCGSSEIIAHLEKITSFESDAPTYIVSMLDHTKRVCKDLRRGIWEGSLQMSNTSAPETLNVIKFFGNPETIFTPMIR